jgi:DNA-binding response OmpR family regulator
MSKLLIVDDEERQRVDICKAAREAGFEKSDWTIATSPTEAIELLPGQTFDLAVVDLHYGHMLEDAGVDLIRRVRAAQPRCKIIALTTKHKSNDHGVRALANGADDYIGRWFGISYQDLLAEKLSIYKALVEGKDFPETIGQ